MALYLIWIIEAGLIISFSMARVLMAVCSTPFCEHCNQWIEDTYSISPLEPITNQDDFKSQLEQGDYTLVKSLKKNDTDTDAYTKVNLLHCASCQQNHFLTIKSIVVSEDSDKKEREKRERYN